MGIITGLTSTTKKNILLDAGAIYKDWVFGTDTVATAAAKLIGATVGGAQLNVTLEYRQMAVDGAKGPTKGLVVIDSVTAVLSATVKEITAKALKLALPTIAETALTGYSKMVISEDLPDTAYATNITYVGKILGASDPIIIVLKNALDMNGLQLQTQDKNEAGIPIVMTAHYDIADLSDVPVEIYLPAVS